MVTTALVFSPAAVTRYCEKRQTEVATPTGENAAQPYDSFTLTVSGIAAMSATVGDKWQRHKDQNLTH